MKYIMINIVACCLLFLLPVCSLAHVLLEPLPGSGAGVDLAGYIRALYATLLGLAAFLAVVKIVVGAIFITAAGGSEANQSKGREMINMALWGLLLALSTFLILRSINPQLVTGVLPLPPPPIN